MAVHNRYFALMRYVGHL